MNDDIISHLTQDQKLRMFEGADTWRTTSIPEAGIEAMHFSDGPNGLRVQQGVGDHLGLVPSMPATCFPPAVGLASTWNRETLRQVGRALGREARGFGVSVLLGPGINIKRSPLCGRNFEYFSEDPRLTAELAGAIVDGLQEMNVGACVKHFAANNQETGRLLVSADIDPRPLREIYLAAFERIIKDHKPWSIMCAYNRLNGVYAAEDRWLLTQVLRDEWGFEGVAVSDWGAVTDPATSLLAGLDLQMPGTGGVTTQALHEALQSGEISEEGLDRAVGRVIECAGKVALEPRPTTEQDLQSNHLLAVEAASEALVLLKNRHGVLPLPSDIPLRTAVLGDMASEPRYQGAGSSQVVPTRLTNALDAIKQRVESAGGEVSFSGDYRDLETAASLASEADVALVFLGLPADEESEGYDRQHLSIPQEHSELLRVAAENADKVVAVYSGGGICTTEWDSDADALLYGFLLGQGGGEATARVLFGETDATGRLAETIPVRLEDTAAFGNFPGEENHVRYGEGTLVGYRWYDSRKLPVAYPFGYGLSFTSFHIDSLSAKVREDKANQVVVGYRVTNTGTRRGAAVPQIYVQQAKSRVLQPPWQLRGFDKVWLNPGEAVELEQVLEPRDFSWWSEARDGWVVEPGEFRIAVGSSSRDLSQCVSVELEGDEGPEELTEESTTAVWLANPAVGARLRSLLQESQYANVLADDAEGRMMRAIPFGRIVAFPGFPQEGAGLLADTLSPAVQGQCEEKQ